MENIENREEIDESLYFGLPPLLPNPRWAGPDLSFGLLSQTRPVSPIETPSIPFIEPPIPPLAFSPNFSLNGPPTFPPQTDPLLDPVSPAPALWTRYRDRRPTQQTGPSFLISMNDLMIDNNESRDSRVSNRDRLEEFPQLRFQRILDLHRTGTGLGTGSGTGTVPAHPDTNPERLMNNILALEASRRNKLKGGKNGTTGTDNPTDRCQCGADFECNICLETSFEPVVTPCGHLFCWKCLFKWMKAQTIGITECPVCKGEITESKLTPIYGRGGNNNGSGPGKVSGSVNEEGIPPRPSGRRTDSLRQQMVVRREGTGGRLRFSGIGTNTFALFAGVGVESSSGLVREEERTGTGTGTGTGGGTGGGTGTDGPSVGGEVQVRRRRRYR